MMDMYTIAIVTTNENSSLNIKNFIAYLLATSFILYSIEVPRLCNI